MKPHRPAVLAWLSAFLVVPGLTGVVRFLAALEPHPASLYLPAWYVPASGLCWGTAFLCAAILIWLPRPWVPAAIRWLTAVCLLGLWGDRILLTRSDFAVQSLPFIMALSCFLYIILLTIFRFRRVCTYYSSN